eukprot:scaffold37762_cov22-Tisochrysis_lutea.AAC.4
MPALEKLREDIKPDTSTHSDFRCGTKMTGKRAFRIGCSAECHVCPVLCNSQALDDLHAQCLLPSHNPARWGENDQRAARRPEGEPAQLPAGPVVEVTCGLCAGLHPCCCNCIPLCTVVIVPVPFFAPFVLSLTTCRSCVLASALVCCYNQLKPAYFSSAALHNLVNADRMLWTPSARLNSLRAAPSPAHLRPSYSAWPSCMPSSRSGASLGLSAGTYLMVRG